MNLPFFWKEDIDIKEEIILFDQENSKHIVQVLRMKKGELLRVTNGNGLVVTAEISLEHKKNCEARIVDVKSHKRHSRGRVAIGISLLKNSSRFEWFLEKATEMGVEEVIPLLCERTEKQHFRYDRMKSICVSAMLQSQQVWLPVLYQPAPFLSICETLDFPLKLIAHCMEGEKQALARIAADVNSQIILIGPEGDFTDKELELAISKNYLPVSLGNTRLRTETAGVASAVLMLIK